MVPSRFVTLTLSAALVLVPRLVPAQRTSSASVDAGSVTMAQFRSFHWIVGRWHGVGFGGLAGVGSFFEEYRVVDDSTLGMRTFSDSTFTRATDSTSFQLRAGRLLAVPHRGATRVVSRFAGDTIQWGPGAMYIRMTDDRWRAVFAARGAGGERPYYELTRTGR